MYDELLLATLWTAYGVYAVVGYRPTVGAADLANSADRATVDLVVAAAADDDDDRVLEDDDLPEDDVLPEDDDEDEVDLPAAAAAHVTSPSASMIATATAITMCRFMFIRNNDNFCAHTGKVTRKKAYRYICGITTVVLQYVYDNINVARDSYTQLASLSFVMGPKRSGCLY